MKGSNGISGAVQYWVGDKASFCWRRLLKGVLVKLASVTFHIAASQSWIPHKEGWENVYSFSFCMLAMYFIFSSFLIFHKPGISVLIQCLLQSSLAFWVAHQFLILIAAPGTYTAGFSNEFQLFLTTRGILGDGEHLLGNTNPAIPAESGAGT